MKIKKTGRWHYKLLSRAIVVMYTLVLISCFSSPIQAHTVPGSVVINGQKTLPLGWYTLHDWPALGIHALDMKPIDESMQNGFDFVMPYFARDKGIAEVLKYMDIAESKGLGIMLDMHPATEEAVGAWAGFVKKHPGLYGYYLEDEPEIRNISAAEVIGKYNAIRAIDPDPNHPVLLVMNKPVSKHTDYLPGCDIVGRELYETSLYSTVKADIATAKSYGKSYFALPGLYVASNHSLPTPEEFRYMVFAPLSVGADGIMPFIFEGVESVCEIPAQGFRDTIVYPSTNHLRLITPTFLKGTVGLSSSCGKTYGDDITWVFAGDANDAVLIAVNNNLKLSRSNVDFTLSGLDPSITTAIVLGENRKICLNDNGYFIDYFNPIGVHIYHFTKVLKPKGETVSIGNSD